MYTFSFRIMADQIGFVVVVLALVTLMFQSPSVSAKLSQCPCVINVNTALADCHRDFMFGRLKEIPNCVPNTTRELIFYGNDLTYKPGQLQGFIFLTYLDLSVNVKFAPSCDSFDSLTRLKSLNLTSTNLKNLKPCVFSKLTNLETLRLSGSRMRYLSADFFGNLNSLSLLDLSYNRLPEISNNIFEGRQNLTYLDLGSNDGLVLNLHSFLGLSKLKSLRLVSDWIPNATSFPVLVFKPLVQLTELNLEQVCSSFENCQAIDQRLIVISTLELLTVDTFVINLLGPGFASLTHLKEINFGSLVEPLLSSCNVTTLSNKTFQMLRNSPITKITITSCKINHIMPFTFSMFRNCTFLEFVNIKLGQVGIKGKLEIGLQNSPIQHLRLGLQGHAGYVPLPVFSGLFTSQLQTLEIYFKPGFWVRCKFFQGLPVSLQHLYLSDNHIITVCFCDLFRLKNLKVLDLSHQDNQIDLQQDSTLCGLPSNETEYANYSASNHSEANTIVNSIDRSVCQKLPVSLNTVNISHSILVCDLVKVLCDSSNFLEYLDISYQGKADCFEMFWKVTKNIFF